MDFKTELADYILSGHAMLSVGTHEKARAIRDMIEVAGRIEYRVYVWSIVTGWRQADGKPCFGSDDTPNPQVAVQQVMSPDVQDKSIFVLKDFGFYLNHQNYNEDDVVVGWLDEIKDRLSNSQRVIVFLGPDFQVPQALKQDITTLEYSLPDDDHIEKSIRFAGSDVETSDGKKFTLNEQRLPDLIRACKGMTQQQILDRATLALRKTKGLDDAAVRVILHEKADVIRASGLLHYSDPPSGGLSMVGGLDALKKRVTLDLPCFGDEARDFGIDYPKGLLLVGVPGSGKTLISIAIASEFGFPLIKMDVGDLMSKWVGESEGNMREAIRILERVAPCVLQLDEVEKGFGGVGSESDGGSSQRVFGRFLKWLNDRTAPVYIVATANDVSKLPPEFSRKGRFDEIFALDLPTQTEREEIFRIHLGKRKRDPGKFDVTKLAKRTENYTGADIEAVIKEGLKLAFHAKKLLTDGFLIEAIGSIVPLFRTEPTRIEKIREWCQVRAKPASDGSLSTLPAPTTRRVSISGSN